MSEEECLHEMPKSQCAICKPSVGPTWDLLYDTVCSVCDRQMRTGEQVRWSADGTTPVHARH